MPVTIDPLRQPSTQTDQALNYQSRSRSTSPPPPIASPLTPAVRPALPVKSQVIWDSSRSNGPQAQDANNIPRLDLIDQPPARPFSGDDATDAIALRAAISSLQFQRQKAEQDIKALRSIRGDALARPDEFQQHIVNVAKQQAKPPKTFDFSKGPAEDGSEDSNDEDGEGTSGKDAAFPPFPHPQDVVRCPPINWDKYHIIGEPLDRMHNAQQNTSGGTGGELGAVAAPYDPVKDKLEKKPGTKGGSKRNSASRRQSRV